MGPRASGQGGGGVLIMSDGEVSARCCLREGFLCVQGHHYRQVPIQESESVRDPLPQDFPGLLFVGKCERCVKVKSRW